MKVIVGLGNPGIEYVHTRHNVGFEVIDRFAEKLGWVRPGEFNKQARSKFNALVLDGIINLFSQGDDKGDDKVAEKSDEKILLVKPQTYMNVSGKSVQAAMAFYQIDLKDVMVVLDDVALPCGTLRLRAAGSSGGHNGLKDIERALGSNAYPRLRIGVDAPPGHIPQRDYVLGKWTAEQSVVLKPTIDRACGAIISWADYGVEKTMSLFNK